MSIFTTDPAACHNTGSGESYRFLPVALHWSPTLKFPQGIRFALKNVPTQTVDTVDTTKTLGEAIDQLSAMIARTRRFDSTREIIHSLATTLVKQKFMNRTERLRFEAILSENFSISSDQAKVAVRVFHQMLWRRGEGVPYVAQVQLGSDAINPRGFIFGGATLDLINRAAHKHVSAQTLHGISSPFVLQSTRVSADFHEIANLGDLMRFYTHEISRTRDSVTIGVRVVAATLKGNSVDLVRVVADGVAEVCKKPHPVAVEEIDDEMMMSLLDTKKIQWEAGSRFSQLQIDRRPMHLAGGILGMTDALAAIAARESAEGANIISNVTSRIEVSFGGLAQLRSPLRSKTVIDAITTRENRRDVDVAVELFSAHSLIATAKARFVQRKAD
jgi:acyl-CoA hydrolase